MNLSKLAVNDGIKLYLVREEIDTIIIPKHTAKSNIAFMQMGTTNLACSPSEAKQIIDEAKMDGMIEMQDGYIHFHLRRIKYIRIPNALSVDATAHIVINVIDIACDIREAEKILALVDSSQTAFMTETNDVQRH